MGLYVIECADRPDGFDLRSSVRPKHLDFVAALGDRMVLAGPFLDNAERMVGSLLVVKADTLAEAEVIAASDPYAKAGLFTTTSVRPWRWVINKPETL
jgi:uncharacterized protein